MTHKQATVIGIVCLVLAGCQGREDPLQNNEGTSSSSSFESSTSSPVSHDPVTPLPLKDNEIRILHTTPDNASLATALSITIEGEAGSEVTNIKAWKFCEGDQSASADISVAQDGKWAFTYNAQPMGICRGKNSIVFQSTSHCDGKTYASGCTAATKFEFESKSGYVYPNSVVFTEKPIHTPGKTVLYGVAGSDVSIIHASIGCLLAETSATTTLYRPPETDVWHWEVSLTENDRTLCKGDVEVRVRSGTQCRGFCNFHNQSAADITLSFEHGYYPPEKIEAQQRVLALQKNVITSITDDPSIRTIISSKALLDCNDMVSLPPELPTILLPPKKLNNDLSVQLVGSGTEASLEFIGHSGDSVHAIPTPFPHSCNDIVIYHMRPDRILLKRAVGHESSAYLSVWNGKEWKTLHTILENQIPRHTSLALKEVNKTHFIVKEDRSCCGGTVLPIVPDRWATFVVEVDTLKIVDVYFDN